ncbi:phage minor tail protein L [Collimonas humicola]|uniref:phage minor tail protein L n=1 Tax=Collimonas humicola TaxID=2825886 RepID=UPI001B8BD222|nr:phage minor tail protein L [Collimonas humicola]
MSNTVTTEVQSLAPSALVELFELDLSKYGSGILRFHSGVNGLNTDVTWQGNAYTRFPISATGFDKRSNGTIPRPVVSVSNIQGLMASTARANSYFLGCKVTRKRTYARFLDAANFPSGNPTADPTQHFPDEMYFIDRKSNETPVLIEWELSSAFDIQGVQLPRRQIIKNNCSWVYRSGECGYAGAPVADAFGNPTSDPTIDKCGKRLSDCKLRYGANGLLPFGGFPGVGLIS